MMVHRLLERYLAGGRSVIQKKYEDLCDHCSSMEQVAANAERASIKYKQVEFMQDKLGMVFDGVISGVTEWGLYVELNENKCEGLYQSVIWMTITMSLMRRIIVYWAVVKTSISFGRPYHYQSSASESGT